MISSLFLCKKLIDNEGKLLILEVEIERLEFFLLKGPYLSSNLFPDEASHENKRLCKISFSDEI